MKRNRVSRKLAKSLSVIGGIGTVLAANEALSRAREADLHGQVALVTGGTRGLGLALARELADGGCRLVICARDETELQTAGEDLERQGAEVLAIRCDVADKADVDRMIAVALEVYGRIDLLICNAGVIQVGELSSMEVADFQQAMDIMYWGVLYTVLAVLPGMRERRAGRIGIVTSIGGKISMPHMLPYNAAKFAAVGLSEGLHAELADDGITVTTIVPGLMRTGSYLNAWFSGDDASREAHYRLFAPISTLPMMSASADRSASVFVRAIRRGAAECIYPFPFSLVARAHGLAPAATTRVLALVDRLLPESGGDQESTSGMAIDAQIHSRGWRWLTTLGRRSAERFRERPGPVSIPDPD